VTLPVFKTGGWQLRCQWCVRLAHASATLLFPSSAVADSGFRQRAQTPAERLNFKTGGWQLRCQWCVRLAHASATFIRPRIGKFEC